MKEYKIGEAAEILNVSVATLQRWDREGKLKALRNASNRRYYTQEQINEYQSAQAQNKDGRENVIYTRVSASLPAADLTRQENFLTDYCNANGLTVNEYLSDIASGLDYDRPEWNQLLQKVKDGKINKIYVSQADRFTRSNFDWFANFCKRHGSEIVVINNPATSPSQELLDDLVSIINDYSTRLPGLRRYKAEIRSDKSLIDSVETADRQVNGFPGAEFMSFGSEQEAMNYLNMNQVPARETKAKHEPDINRDAYSAVIYTSGACRSTGTHRGGHVKDTDKAAWAYLIESDGKKLSDSALRLGATNNEMEVTAFLESLKKLEELDLTQQPLLFVLTSQYVLNSVQGPAWLKSWKKRDWKTANGKPVVNREIWQEVDRELAKFDMSKLDFKWVKSAFVNDFVDSLLNKRMDE
ncbi:IS607 family transposase [Lactobacillus sp. 23-2]|uniref:IS607 family transposase n=1 Tax=Lactobacillus sp. 23-2 TaxID=2981842 RepID=UPI003834ED0D